MKNKPVTLEELYFLKEMLAGIEDILPALEDAETISPSVMALPTNDEYDTHYFYARALEMPDLGMIVVGVPAEVDDDGDTTGAPESRARDQQAAKLLTFLTHAPQALARLIEYAEARLS